MARFRDFDAENDRIFAALDLPEDATVIEIGCGTGTFALAAARRFRKVIAYDVSEAMLEFARGKACSSGLDNVTFRHGGFLGCHEGEPPVDAVVSQFALHHLPDFWKEVALRRVAGMLKPEGKFFLNDVVFSFPLSEYPQRFAQWIESLPEDTRENAKGHLSREYSSPWWLMRFLLDRSGFRVVKDWTPGGFISAFLCSRQIDPESLDDFSRVLEVDDETEISLMTPDCAEAAFEWIEANREHLRRWVPFPEWIETLDDETGFLRSCVEIPATRRGFPGRIMHRGRFAGTVGTKGIDPINRSAEIGYALGKEFEGKGLMTRCCRRFLDYLFDERKANRVVIRCAEGNERSAGVAKRLGFQFEGVQRQALKLQGKFVNAQAYSMLKEEWEAKRE